MYKKITILLLSFVLLFLCVPTKVSAGEIASGTCGENLVWTLSDEGVLRISGSGDMLHMNVVDNSVPWKNLRQHIITVVVGEGVTTIGNAAFNNCSNLTTVNIPDGVTAIGNYAFSNCSNLTTVNIPDSVTAIGREAFMNCYRLVTVSIPDSVTTIGKYAFSDCISLITANIPAAVTAINESTFFRCISLTTINIPANITTIGKYAFLGCNAIETIVFDGAPPKLEGNGVDAQVFMNVVATAYYPAFVGAVSQDVKDTYGENLTWVSYRDGETPWEKPKFEDVKSDAYYAEAVQWAVEERITNGYGSATTFCPDMTCTRGQVVTFLWRAKGCPEPTSNVNPFTDIKESDYYYKAVLWAVENGITSGYGSSTIFNPDGACTRGQVATFLWRAEGEPSMSGAANPFTDVASGQYYYDAVLWAVANGVTNGYGGNTTFAPDVICNRGQIVTFLYRAEE